jgi:hypothetical protein
MPPKSLNRLLADNLSAEMARRHLSDKGLGEKASVAPNTIANYCRELPPTSTGKERSAKLLEVERIAQALGMHPLALLSEPGASAERLSSAEVDLLAQYRALTDWRKKFVGEALTCSPRALEMAHVYDALPANLQGLMYAMAQQMLNVDPRSPAVATRLDQAGIDLPGAAPIDGPALAR